MKKELSAIDIYFLIKELKPRIENSKIEKVFHIKEDNDFFLRLYNPEFKKNLLRIKLPGFFYLTEFKHEFLRPSGFAMMLRRHIQGSKIEEFYQKDFDRVVVFKIDVRKKGIATKKFLIIELFSNGNLILTDENLKIIGLLKSLRTKDRILKPGKIYKFPESQFNLFNATEQEIENTLKNAENKERILASQLSAGGEYAKELLSRSKINNTTLTDEISKLKQLIPKGFIYKNTVTPFKCISCEEIIKEYSNFYKALDEAISPREFAEKQQKLNKNINKENNRVETILKKQKEMISKFEKEYIDAQKKGELIYENYIKINNILTKINELKKNHSWSDIKKQFKNIVINEKNNEIIIDTDNLD